MSNEVLKDPFSIAPDRVQAPVQPKAARDAWTDTDLSRIASQARQAFEQKRLKNCLNFIKVLLEADPQNEEAQALESAVRTAIQTDLEHARALMHDVQFADSPQVFGKGAEIILRRVLTIDPEEPEAKALLAELQERTPSRPVASQPVSAVEPPTLYNSGPEDTSAPFTVIATGKLEEYKKTGFLQTRLPWIGLGALVLLAAYFLFGGGEQEAPEAEFDARASEASPANTAPLVSSTPVQPSAPADGGKLSDVGVVKLDSGPSIFGIRLPVPEKSILDNSQRIPAVQPEKPKTLEPLPDPALKSGTAIPAKAPTAPERPSTRQPAAGEATGNFAVNSRVPADIYLGDRYLGSTPTTLELPSGTHTLEYRYESLRKVVTEVIRPGETKTSTINFEVTVEINARPWAQVSVVGVENRPLGQTPLSNVTVPVGSTLVFENPNFPKKSYRVTGKETSVRVVFP